MYPIYDIVSISMFYFFFPLIIQQSCNQTHIVQVICSILGTYSCMLTCLELCCDVNWLFPFQRQSHDFG